MSLHALYKQIEKQNVIEIPEGWSQGRTIYGGLVAGILMHKAVVTIADPSKHLLSCHTTFVGPVKQGRVELSAEILRQGKSVTTLEVRLWQEGAVQSILIASFGAQRTSSISVPVAIEAPQYPDITGLEYVKHHPLAPECFKQMEMAWVEGQYPCSASAQPDFGGYFRFNPALHDNREMNVADVMVAFDMWPPGVLPMFKSMAPASSLTWQVSCVYPLQAKLHDWLKYKVVTDYAEKGYSTEHAYLWDQQNRLIAIARQTVTVFA